MQQFSSTFTENIPSILNEKGISLILSTYQAGKIVIISSDGEKVYQLVRDFNRPMGIAVYKDMLALAGALNVTLFRTDRELARTYPKKPDVYDAFFYPIAINKTDYIDIHDIAFTKDGLVGVNTSFSCLVKLDGQYSFNPIWKPHFIDKLLPNDFCHLNGMAIDENREIAYVTAFGETTHKEAWRDNKMTGGILIDVRTNKIVLKNLSMPHAPRLYRGTLYMLLSGTEELIKVDVKAGTYQVVAKIDGFIRGLSFKDDLAFVGVSKLRKSHTFGDLEIANKDIKSGVVIVDLTSSEIIGDIMYGNSIEEIYDVHILENTKRANIISYQQSLEQRALITPFGSSWISDELQI